jgi:signal transduction histidine kinase
MLELARPHRPELRVQSLGTVVEALLAESLRNAPTPVDVHLTPGALASALPLSVDAERLSLALAAVIRNAIQAMPGGGALHIDAGLDPVAPEHWSFLSIRDTGTGIPREVHQRIFEPFFTTRSTGSGMGLAIAKRVLAEHGGELTVESETGQGTTVLLRLPLQVREEAG